MPLKKQTLSITLCLLLLIPIFSTFYAPTIVAAPATGRTKLYFKDALSTNLIDFDSSGQFALLSEIPPTKDNVSSYPPLISDLISLSLGSGIQIDNETAYAWLMTWAITLFENLEGIGDIPEEWGDLFDQMNLILPNPLRIVQGYKNTGNESINVNGNIDYDLFFKNKFSSRIHKNDQVKFSAYTYSESSLFPAEIDNNTHSLKPGYFQKTMQLSQSLTNISVTIQPGQLILFSVEMIPGNKTLPTIYAREKSMLNNFTKIIVKAIRQLSNFTGLSVVEDGFALLEEITNIINEEEIGLNFTKKDIANVVESLISVSLLYDSTDYPSSVTVPFKATTNNDNTYTEYLHANNVLNKNQPDTATHQTVNLATSIGTWKGQELLRNKIITDASAIVYINHKDLQKWGDTMAVEAALTHGNATISTDIVSLDRTRFFSSSTRPYRFTFDDIGSGTELTYGKKIGLKVSLTNATDASNLFRNVEIFFDSNDYASMITYSLSETDHIQAFTSSNPSSGKIIVGENVIHSLDITSELNDIISVKIKEDTFSQNEKEYWDVSISSNTVSIEENGNETITIITTSTGNSLAAYEEDPLILTMEIIGNTGYNTVQLSADVSEDAVTFDTIIEKPKDKEITHGTNESFVFTIKNNNTGLWKDSYVFSAEADKNLSVIVDPSTFNNLDAGNETTVNVTLIVPKNTEIEDVSIILTITSKRSQLEHQVTVNATIIGANLFESTFNYFKDISESLGLKEIFGSYAPIILASIIFIVIFFILIIMALLFTTKYVDIICIDRIKEIDPDESATYEITLKNRTNKNQTYNLRSNLTEMTSSWQISYPSNPIIIPAKKQKTVKATVSTTDEVNPGEWIEFQLIVTTEGKNKEEKIPLFCSLSDGSISLSIKDVFHWPKSFSKNEKVSTSLRLENKGTVQAKNVAVKLFINNKEKNKVEELIIPAKGYADITIPWIAEKGKNDLRIIVA